METLNCLGMTCPQPVIETKNTLLGRPEINELKVLVDNVAAAQNVERFLGTQGFTVTVQGAEPEFTVIGVRRDQEREASLTEKAEPTTAQKILILISRDVLGSGDDALGTLLMLNFLRTLKEMGSTLWRLVFVNAGVKLTIQGVETLPILQELEKAGVSILVCGTCLNHFGLLEKKQCGQTTNMLDIITSLEVADKVITL